MVKNEAAPVRLSRSKSELEVAQEIEELDKIEDDQTLIGQLKRSFSEISKRHRQRAFSTDHHPFPAVQRIVLMRGYDAFMISVILANCFLIGFQAQTGKPEGGAKVVFMIFEITFTIIFLTELVMRVMVFGWSWLFQGENIPDVILVILSVLTTPLSIANVGFAEILRKFTVLRTIRLMRVARAVRLYPQFKEMWSLIRGLMDSLPTLFWTYVMIGCVLYFYAIVATTMIGKSSAFEGDDDTSVMAREYFGDVLASMLTLFQVMTLDSWSSIMRPLNDRQGWICIFFIVFICSAVFVLMNLVTAVIVENAFAAGRDDQAEQARLKEQEKDAEIASLKEIFEQIDINGDGTLSKEELDEQVQQRHVKTKLRTFDIGAKDLNVLWSILDDGDGQLETDEFINGIRKLKGDAKALDVMKLQKELKLLDMSVDEIEWLAQVSQERMQISKQRLAQAKVDMTAFKRAIRRAKEALQHVEKTQPRTKPRRNA